jgi:hypothetical protein
VLEAGSGTKFLTISANPTLWTLFGSHKELGGASNTLSQVGAECIPILGVALVQKSSMFITLIKRVNKHQIDPHDTIGKALNFKCLKFPHIVHLDLKFMSYDQKTGWESN